MSEDEAMRAFLAGERTWNDVIVPMIKTIVGPLEDTELRSSFYDGLYDACMDYWSK